jgi:SAM-dependent methyltransferase
MDVRDKVLGDTDLASARVLEIGALHNPRLRKDEGNVSYLDLAPTDALRTKYQDNRDAAPHLSALVDVDYVWKPGETLSDAVGGGVFDLVIASHVIEHVADPIGWLGQVSEILVDGGRLSLVVPDKRYCFDVNRQLTTMADLVDAYLRQLDAPGARHIFDCEVNYIHVSAQELWAGVDVSHCRRTDVADPEVHAYQLCQQIAATGEYRDEHCSTFTPTSFLRLFRTIVALALSGLAIERIHPTEPDWYEFFVMLAKRRTKNDTPAVLAHIDSLIAEVERRERDARAASVVPGAVQMTVSPREHTLIMRKRAAMSAIRSGLARRPR